MERKQLIFMLALAIALIISAPALTEAQEVGRYQALSVDSKEKPGVFILDTKEGHLWLWERGVRGEEKDIFRIIYQGQVTPGKKIGVVIEKGRQKTPKK